MFCGTKWNDAGDTLLTCGAAPLRDGLVALAVEEQARPCARVYLSVVVTRGGSGYTMGELRDVLVLLAIAV